MDKVEDIRVEEIAAGSVEEPRFLKVENLTAGFVTLLHPSLEDKRHKTIGPRRIVLLDKAFKEVGDNQQLVDLGVIKWEIADELEADDGRQKALGQDYAMDDRQLEYLVQQILLFPEDDLDMRDGGAIRPGTGVPNIPAMAHVVYELIMAAPRNEGDRLINVDYLKQSHLPMLENALAREKMWRNRPAIVGLLERRIGELRAMDSSGRVMGV